jgi:hypothetical protein
VAVRAARSSPRHRDGETGDAGVDHLDAKGLAHYSDTWFATVEPSLVAGEKSTDYLESAVAAERIVRNLPDVKLVFILREPVARAYSNYLWTKMNGIETEEFATALALEAEREGTLPEKWRFARPFSYFSRGLYADLLAPYVRNVPRDRLLILKFEDIIDAPEALATQLQRFVGVAERPADARGLGVINPSEKEMPLPSNEVTRELAQQYVEPNRRLAALLGPSFVLWP